MDSDTSTWYGSKQDDLIFFVERNTNVIYGTKILYTSSGNTAPGVDYTRRIWYDTTNKMIKMYAPNESNYTEVSLPIATGKSSGVNNAITSIDQVFNGFGYIGSTVFALPGIEGLIPNGRNEDGSLNNTKFTTNSVLLFSPTTGTYNVLLTLTAHRFFWNNSAKYDQENNYNLNDAGIMPQLILGYANFISGRITSFKPKTTFQAVDRSDTEWASSAGKPSNKYVDLTLGATGSSYTAPANGYFLLNKSITQTELGEYINIWVDDVLWAKVNSPISHQTCLSVSVKKGDVCRIDYTASGVTNTFKFCYDEGVKQ